MKLHIHNRLKLYKLMAGSCEGRFDLVETIESKEYYDFRFADRVKKKVLHIKLKRDSHYNRIDKEHQYHFITTDGYSHAITADWFADLDNAKEAFLTELERFIKNETNN